MRTRRSSVSHRQAAAAAACWPTVFELSAHRVTMRASGGSTSARCRRPRARPTLHSACGRNSQRRLDPLGDAQPRVRPHRAEPYCAATDWPE